MDMVLFSAFFGAAAYYRNRPELHKRLMIVAASSILIASTGRFSGSLGLEGASAHAVLLLLWLLPILFAMGYDALRYRMIHPVYVIGATVIAISSFRGPLQYTEETGRRAIFRPGTRVKKKPRTSSRSGALFRLTVSQRLRACRAIEPASNRTRSRSGCPRSP